MRLDIVHKRINVVPQRSLFRMRKWGDPLMVKWFSLSVDLAGTTNFQVIQLFNLDMYGQMWPGAVDKFQKLRYPQDYDFLKSIQTEQGPEQYGTVKAKMNWFVNHDDGIAGRPYWFFNGEFRFGTLVFGGQLVEVESSGGKPVEYVAKGRFRGGHREAVFYRLLGMRRSEMGQVTYDSHPWKIQHGTETFEGDVYNEYPRGYEHFHPVWSDIDWPTNKHFDTRLFVARVSTEGGDF